MRTTQAKLPFLLTVGPEVVLTIDTQTYSSEGGPYALEVATEEDGDQVVFTEPIHKTRIGFASAGLTAIYLYFSSQGLFVIGTYDRGVTEASDDGQCCVSCSGTTACGMSVCMTCNSAQVGCNGGCD
jgi:hypothetical protein